MGERGREAELDDDDGAAHIVPLLRNAAQQSDARRKASRRGIGQILTPFTFYLFYF